MPPVKNWREHLVRPARRDNQASLGNRERIPPANPDKVNLKQMIRASSRLPQDNQKPQNPAGRRGHLPRASLNPVSPERKAKLEKEKVRARVKAKVRAKRSRPRIQVKARQANHPRLPASSPASRAHNPVVSPANPVSDWPTCSTNSAATQPDKIKMTRTAC